MSLFFGFQKPCTQCLHSVSANTQLRRQFLKVRSAASPGLARYASSKSPIGPGQIPASKKIKPARKVEPYTRKRQVDPSKRALIFLNSLNKDKQKEIPVQPRITSGTDASPSTTTLTEVESSDSGAPEADKQETNKPVEAVKTANTVETAEATEIDEKEVAIRRRIVEQRAKLMWPGIWTLLAVGGTFGTLASMDAKRDRSIDITQLSERVQIPQSWFLTPTVVQEGIKAGWNELDKLTIGIVVVSIGIHFLRKLPLPIWARLIHVTGEQKYTAFTYPFVHSHWAHLGHNLFGLCWFLPGVVHYLDDNVLHTAALFASVPLVTSYLQHFIFRWGSIKGIPLNMGASGAVAAIFGAFCMAYPNEKVWTPNFLVFRLDAKYCGVLFALWQLAVAVKMPKGGSNRPAVIVSCQRTSHRLDANLRRSIL
jgi:membrane associated rhomboid family serine protease